MIDLGGRLQISFPTFIIIIIIIIIWKCLFDLYQVPSSNQEPQICESCEVKFKVYCIYLVSNM